MIQSKDSRPALVVLLRSQEIHSSEQSSVHGFGVGHLSPSGLRVPFPSHPCSRARECKLS